MYFKMDTSNWQRKIQNIQRTVNKTIVQTVDEVTEDMRQKINEKIMDRIDEINANPKKVNNKETKQEIKRLKNILESFKVGKIAPNLTTIWSDGSIAPENRMVHDGTKKFKPFRFMSDTFDQNRTINLDIMKKRLLNNIRKQGR